MSTILPEGKNFKIPSNFDGTSKESVELLLEDLEKEVKQMQSNLSLLEFQANKELQEIYFLRTLKLERNIRNMTVRDFNEKYLNGESLIQMVKGFCQVDGSTSAATVQRSSQYACVTSINKNDNHRPENQGRMEMETPARNVSNWKVMRTPATILRTARKGESIL